MSDKNEQTRQRNYEARLEGLGKLIDDMIKEDNGAKALEAIRRARRKDDDDVHGLRGLPGSKQKEA